jgi:hypothetical protein
VANLAITSTPTSLEIPDPEVTIYDGSAGIIDAIVEVLGYYQGPTT